MQASLGIVGLIALALVLVFLPETSHPGTRGIDNAEADLAHEEKKSRGLVMLNPFSALALMRSPVLLLTVGLVYAYMRLDFDG